MQVIGGSLQIGPFWINWNEIEIKLQRFSYTKMILKKCRLESDGHFGTVQYDHGHWNGMAIMGSMTIRCTDGKTDNSHIRYTKWSTWLCLTNEPVFIYSLTYLSKLLEMENMVSPKFSLLTSYHSTSQRYLNGKNHQWMIGTNWKQLR